MDGGKSVYLGNKCFEIGVGKGSSCWNMKRKCSNDMAMWPTFDSKYSQKFLVKQNHSN